MGAKPSFFEGNKYDDTTIYNDAEKLNLKDSCKHKICRIGIWFDMNYVYGLEVTYKFADGHCESSGTHVGRDCGWTNQNAVFEIDDDDYLCEIYGHSGDWIDQIGFRTTKGKTAIFGGTGGVPYRHCCSSGQHFAIINVGVRKYLDFVYAQPIAINQDFLKYRDNKPVTFQHHTGEIGTGGYLGEQPGAMYNQNDSKPLYPPFQNTTGGGFLGQPNYAPPPRPAVERQTDKY